MAENECSLVFEVEIKGTNVTNLLIVCSYRVNFYRVLFEWFPGSDNWSGLLHLKMAENECTLVIEVEIEGYMIASF